MDDLAAITARGHLKDCLLAGPEHYEWAVAVRRKMERFKGWRIQEVHLIEELSGEDAVYYVPEIGPITRLKIEDHAFAGPAEATDGTPRATPTTTPTSTQTGGGDGTIH